MDPIKDAVLQEISLMLRTPVLYESGVAGMSHRGHIDVTISGVVVELELYPHPIYLPCMRTLDLCDPAFFDKVREFINFSGGGP